MCESTLRRENTNECVRFESSSYHGPLSLQQSVRQQHQLEEKDFLQKDGLCRLGWHASVTPGWRLGPLADNYRSLFLLLDSLQSWVLTVMTFLLPITTPVIFPRKYKSSSCQSSCCSTRPSLKWEHYGAQPTKSYLCPRPQFMLHLATDFLLIRKKQEHVVPFYCTHLATCEVGVGGLYLFIFASVLSNF